MSLARYVQRVHHKGDDMERATDTLVTVIAAIVVGIVFILLVVWSVIRFILTMMCLVGYIIALPFIEGYKRLIWLLRKRD